MEESMDKKAIVMGAGGFIGSHMVKRLKKEGYYVKGVDLKNPEFSNTEADDFIIGDLRDPKLVADIIDSDYDELYQFAADMGGAGYIFTGENDANVMHNSAIINLNVADECVKKGVKKVFYSSSACMYPEHNQLDPDNPNCEESSAYPANPDSEYGWEKLFSERLFFFQSSVINFLTFEGLLLHSHHHGRWGKQTSSWRRVTHSHACEWGKACGHFGEQSIQRCG